MGTETERKARKRVWILGAGFSRSLGGPLMHDLLSLAARGRIFAAYPHINKLEVDTVFWLFHYGNGFREGPLDPDLGGRGEHAWSDAEQFLETLDAARSNAGKAAVVDAVISGVMAIAEGAGQWIRNDSEPRLDAFRTKNRPTAHALGLAAKRVLAASCCAFLAGIDHAGARSKERWQPYQEWLRFLGDSDSVLTFNYDLAVELLRPVVEEPAGMGPVVTRIRVREVDSTGPMLAGERCGGWLYKLHGSANWTLNSEGALCCKGWMPDMLNKHSNEDVAIATPGDGKMAMAGGVFQRLWRDAVDVLRAADEVIIVGFRFPPSDAFPRDTLLAALRDNENDRLCVHLVLGPEQNADLRRVTALLEWTLGVHSTHGWQCDRDFRSLMVHDLWAEDFLGGWARDRRRE